jgi:Lon protease-like protein
VKAVALAVSLVALSSGHDGARLLAAQAAAATAPVLRQPPATLPAEIPLFPLPETTLFPGVSQPFVIFEPRYREMIADALKGDRIIGMVRLRPGFEQDYEGRPPIFTVGCAGVIDEYEQLPDGRFIILLRGLTTFRIAGEDQRRPYRLARVTAIPDALEAAERLPLSLLRSRIEKLLIALLPLGTEPPDGALDDSAFVNVVAQNLGMPESARQDLLERSSVVERAGALADLLEKP